MAGLPRITPALYGSLDVISGPAINALWDKVIVEFLSNEEEIYFSAFKIYSFIIPIKLSKMSSFKMFWVIIEEACPKIVEALQSIDEIKNPGYTNRIPQNVFYVYWDMAFNKNYWVNGEIYLDNYLPYAQMLDIWEHEGTNNIQWCKERMEKWKTVP